MQRIDGQIIDIPPAVRGFQRYSSETRSNMTASHRLGFRQREQIGEAFWTHPYCPDVCFPTRIAALRAAIGRLACEPV